MSESLLCLVSGPSGDLHSGVGRTVKGTLKLGSIKQEKEM